MYTNFEILTNGNLCITLTDEGREEMPEIKEQDYHSALATLLEYPTCNGLCWVQPEQIGALTDSPILSDLLIDEDTTQEELDTANVWWFPEYETVLELDELEKNGKLIFTLAK